MNTEHRPHRKPEGKGYSFLTAEETGRELGLAPDGLGGRFGDLVGPSSPSF